MMDLDDVIAAIGTVLETISTIKHVYTKAPESVNEFPSAVIVEKKQTNAVRAAPDVFRQDYLISVQVLTKRADLPTAVADLRDFPRLLADAFKDDHSLGGNCLITVFEGGDLKRIEWNSIPYIGWDCTLRVIDV